MVNKKKLLFFLLLLLVAAMITACGDDNGGDDATDDNATEDQASEDNQDTASGDADNGKEIFKNNCLACHGAEGAGGHNGPNLQDSDMAKDKDAVIAQVTNGSGNMPPFGDTLSEQEINDVAEYITTVIAPKGD